MKLLYIFPILLFVLLSCNNLSRDSQTENDISGPTEKPSFFPVTDFIKGQIVEIKNKGINPLKITEIDKHSDSSWIKQENLNAEFSPFLSPEIDSVNLTGMFTEKRFLDQTIDAFTFTYDPIKQLPVSFLLQRWDVYIDPKSNNIKRIYLVKTTPDHKKILLTWQANKSCKIVTISNDQQGNDRVEKEETIKWDF